MVAIGSMLDSSSRIQGLALGLEVGSAIGLDHKPVFGFDSPKVVSSSPFAVVDMYLAELVRIGAEVDMGKLVAGVVATESVGMIVEVGIEASLVEVVAIEWVGIGLDKHTMV